MQTALQLEHYLNLSGIDRADVLYPYGEETRFENPLLSGEENVRLLSAQGGVLVRYDLRRARSTRSTVAQLHPHLQTDVHEEQEYRFHALVIGHTLRKLLCIQQTERTPPTCPPTCTPPTCTPNLYMVDFLPQLVHGRFSTFRPQLSLR